MTSTSAGELLRRALRDANVDALYGTPWPPLRVTPVPEEVAGTFALAHQLVHGARAGVHAGAAVFRFPGLAPGPCQRVEVDSAAALVGALSLLASPSEVELRCTLDPAEPVDDRLPVLSRSGGGWEEPAADAVEALRRAGTVAVLAGPGVVRQSAVPGLHDLAAAANLGVLNTWGAKGIFDWRSRHHLATIGLQEHDFVLAGLGEVDVILATGLDPRESPDARWQLAPSVEVAPGALAPLAECCERPIATLPVPPLRVRLAEVTQRGWTGERGPLPPSRVTKHYGECLEAGALVAADAGLAGFWVARTLGTTRLGGVIVPASPTPGLAAACVAVAALRRPDQPALAVVDGSQVGPTDAVIDAARSLGTAVPVEVWDPAGERLDAEAHGRRLRRMLQGSDPPAGEGRTLATDPRQLDEMLEAAGPIVAWTSP